MLISENAAKLRSARAACQPTPVKRTEHFFQIAIAEK